MILSGVPEDSEDLPPKPDVLPHLKWVWRAWHRLSSDRIWIPVGMGAPIPARIPWSVVKDYAETHGLSMAEFFYMDHLMGAMDAVFIQHVKDQVSKGSDKPASQSIDEKIKRWESS